MPLLLLRLDDTVSKSETMLEKADKSDRSILLPEFILEAFINPEPHFGRILGSSNSVQWTTSCMVKVYRSKESNSTSTTSEVCQWRLSLHSTITTNQELNLELCYEDTRSPMPFQLYRYKDSWIKLNESSISKYKYVLSIQLKMVWPEQYYGSIDKSSWLLTIEAE